MTEHFEAQINREELTQIPPPSKWTSILKWLVPAIVLLAFGYGIQKSEGGSLEEMLLAWILPNSIAAALMATIAGAKPLTVLVAGVGSPITSLNPLLGVGMVAGLEAWLRNPLLLIATQFTTTFSAPRLLPESILASYLSDARGLDRLSDGRMGWRSLARQDCPR